MPTAKSSPIYPQIGIRIPYHDEGIRPEHGLTTSHVSLFADQEARKSHLARNIDGSNRNRCVSVWHPTERRGMRWGRRGRLVTGRFVTGRLGTGRLGTGRLRTGRLGTGRFGDRKMGDRKMGDRKILGTERFWGQKDFGGHPHQVEKESRVFVPISVDERRLVFPKGPDLYSTRSRVIELASGMRQLAGTSTKYRRADAAPLAGLISILQL